LEIQLKLPQDDFGRKNQLDNQFTLGLVAQTTPMMMVGSCDETYTGSFSLKMFW
jgi:hypothetical protein